MGRCEQANDQPTVHANYGSYLVAQARKISRISLVGPRDRFFGGGITLIGLVTASAAAVGIGTGAIAAAGLLSTVFAVLGFSPDVNEDAEIVAESTNSAAPLVHDLFVADQRLRWPSKTPAPLQYERL